MFWPPPLNVTWFPTLSVCGLHIKTVGYGAAITAVNNCTNIIFFFKQSAPWISIPFQWLPAPVYSKMSALGPAGRVELVQMSVTSVGRVVIMSVWQTLNVVSASYIISSIIISSSISSSVVLQWTVLLHTPAIMRVYNYRQALHWKPQRHRRRGRPRNTLSKRYGQCCDLETVVSRLEFI